ncbi:alpha/beta fold hydrolase [Aurantimonas sp. NFXS3]|jgi:predicted alpha/beta hydrolase|uniref:alpha/beta hydrolase family protein n=1 Tax=Aurantimonas sp. NFXS3 TaxID=2818434 RepID=UPI003B8DBF87
MDIAATASASARPVAGRDLTLTTADGVTLPATLFRAEPAGDGPAVLISAAAAVERRFYRGFAQHLVDQGARAVLTYDYRGIGASAHDRGAAAYRMQHWGTQDFPAALAALEAAAGEGPVVGIGHSFGGLAIGLSGLSARFDRYVMVASLNGWYGRTREPLSVFARMNLLGVPMSRLTGRIPGSIGFGTALAGPVFRDWARWCRRRDFFFGDPAVPEAARFADVRLPLLSVGIEDDPWGTPAAVGALLQRFENAELSEIWLSPRDAGGPIGHNGFFRRDMQASLWPVVTDYLLAGVEPVRPPSPA